MSVKQVLRMDQLSQVPTLVFGALGIAMIWAGHRLMETVDEAIVPLEDWGDE